MQEWSLLIGVIALAITTVGVIATILNVEKSTARVALLLLLGCVGVFAIGTVVVGIAKWPPANPVRRRFARFEFKVSKGSHRKYLIRFVRFGLVEGVRQLGLSSPSV